MNDHPSTSLPTSIFVTGTHTGIGKTFTSAVLVSALLQRKISCGYFKPIQTGDDSDSDTLLTLTELPPSSLKPPTYQFKMPSAPSRAAAAEDGRIDLNCVKNDWDDRKLSSEKIHQTFVVEGAGGLLVPLNSQETIRELIVSLNLPVVLVATTQLGTINHTLLTLEALAAKKITTRGIIWVGDEDPGLEESIAEFSHVPSLTRLPWLADISRTQIPTVARKCIADPVFERIFYE